MQKILELIKKILPKSVLKKIRPLGHGFLAYAAALWFGFPSRRMVVIGITGTAGKSTTVQMLAKILNTNGHKAGFSTTVSYSDGDQEHINPDGMSMAGKFRLQGYLKAMLDRGCTHAIVEATSEGLVQNRHLGIDFDVCAITMLAPVHIDAHGTFENYKHAKGRLFTALQKSKRKDFFPHKYIGANLDNEYSEFFLSFPADKHFGTTLYSGAAEVALEHVQRNLALADHVYAVKGLAEAGSGQRMEINGVGCRVNMPGKFNAYNAAMAVAIANMLGVALPECAAGLSKFTGIAGRMELIPNNRGITVYLDYAAAPVAMQASLEAFDHIPHKRLIHAFGSPGGHRDVGMRFKFGELSARHADAIIIMNEDVYDSDPQVIADNIRTGAMQVPEHERKAREVLTILDRREGIKKALEMAEPGDIVLVTGKGIEQFLFLPGNKRIDWDDKKVIQEYLK